MLTGLMQDDFQLTVQHMLRRMRSPYADAEVVSLTPAGSMRATFGEIASARGPLGAGARALGRAAGRPRGTFAWNNQRHFELYMAVPSRRRRSAHVQHTGCPPTSSRISSTTPKTASIFVDDSLAALLAPLAPHMRSPRQYVVMGEGESLEEAMQKLPGALSYEELLAEAGDGIFEYPSSTSARRRLCATRAGRRATRRASCTHTARSACTPRRR